ncbi:MAG: discoidin domain-containing protein [Actinomycetales bacterium]
MSAARRHRPRGLVGRVRSLRRAARTAMLVGLVTALACVGLTTPSAASFEVKNFADAGIMATDGAPLYSYSSGTTTQWISNSAFQAGTLSNVETTKAQNFASAQISGGQVYLRTHGASTSPTAADWGPALTMPPSSSGTSKVSVAARADGLLAVAVIAGTQLRVTRQSAPGVWPAALTWVTIPTTATPADAELIVQPNGFLSVAYMDTAGVSYAASETALGVWGASTNLGGVGLHISLAGYPNGDEILTVVGANNASYWQRKKVAGVWQAWVRECSTALLPMTDLSTVVSQGRAVIYGLSALAISSCAEPATGTTWTYAPSIYTGLGLTMTTIGAASRNDGRILVLASVNGTQASGVQEGIGQPLTLTTIDGSYSDQEVAGYYPDTGISLVQTGTTYATSGTWTSATVDTGASGSGVYGLLRTSHTLPTGTDVRFQVAAASSSTPTAFIGPDGTAATYYTSAGGPLPYAVDGLRYLRVRAYLTGTTAATPRLNGLSLRYHLTRLPRSVDGTYAVTAPADAVSWIARMSTPATELALGGTTLVDQGSTWGAANSFTAHLDTLPAQCCAPAQFTVTGGVSTPTGAAATPVISSGGRLGQSYVLQRSRLYAGSGAVTATSSLSSTMQVQWPMSVTLGRDVAIGGVATQKTDYSPSGGLAPVAVDANTDGAYPNGSVTATTYTTQAWWKVDLGSQQQIAEIRLWNRTDCCSERLHDYTILASPSPIDTTNLQTAMQSVSAANGYLRLHSGSASARTDVSLLPTGTQARYVAVILMGKTSLLSLAEVEVRTP